MLTLNTIIANELKYVRKLTQRSEKHKEKNLNVQGHNVVQLKINTCDL